MERNLPQAPVGTPTPIITPDAVPASEDATPIGPALRTIVLLDNDDRADSQGFAPGVDTSRLPLLHRAEVRRSLGKFIGQTLSRQLIAEIQAEIARQARAAGHPFVSLSTPEQEITDGVLQLRVTEFRLSEVQVRGAPEGASIRDRLRVIPSQPINSDLLVEDLDWLNRNPFRDASAQFAPATPAGETELSVVVTQRRPYRLYAGYANSGSDSTGLDRYFVGAIAALPVLTDAYVSYQATGSGDFWYDGGAFRNSDPSYVSHGVRFYVPTLPRQDIEFTFSDVVSNQAADVFDVRQRTTEGTLAYRTALSNFGLKGGSGDVLVGLEAKRQSRLVLFGGQTALDVSADVYQVLAGWSKGWQDSGSQGSVNVSLHASPGGVSDRSSGANLASLTNGRVASDRYAYATIDVTNGIRLPRNFALTTQISAQFANEPMPLSAQIGLGGDSLVRGYTPDDGSFDRGVVTRTELRAPPMALFGRGEGFRDQLLPYLFLDAGYGKDLALKTSSGVISAGLGADYNIGRSFSAGLTSAWALKDGARTREGEWLVQVRTTISY